MMLKNALLKKNFYELEYSFELKNCCVLSFDDTFIYFKIQDFSKITEIKNEIVKFIRKNPELYCDCKKSIFYIDTFEEVIKVKRNDIDVEIYQNYDVSLLLYGIWFKSSYGPMIKCMSVTPLRKELSFLPDPDDYCSDEEINESIQHYAKINQFKEKSKKVKKKNEIAV